MSLPEKVALIANIVEIAVGGLALYIALTQKDKITLAFAALLNHTLQSSLSDFKHWLKKLEDSNTEDANASKEVRVALAHLAGKIKGNKTLYKHFGEKMLKRLRVMIEDLDDGGLVTETSIVSLCSEIREILATLEVDNFKVR